MSGQEENCLILSLVTQAILYPKLLIRYQKTINEKAEFPTRLVIPTMKFTATFTKIGDLGIRRILDEWKVNYSRVSIVRASELKEILEELKVKKDKVTIASFDTINMYLSIKLSTIKKAVNFFSRKLTAETKKIVNLCLDIIRFRMSSTLTSFDGDYYDYHSREKDKQGLAIGG